MSEVILKLRRRDGSSAAIRFDGDANLETVLDNFKKFLLASGYIVDPFLELELIDREAEDRFIQELQNKIDELDAALTAKEME